MKRREFLKFLALVGTAPLIKQPLIEIRDNITRATEVKTKSNTFCSVTTSITSFPYRRRDGRKE